jgi:uncharacterized protein
MNPTLLLAAILAADAAPAAPPADLAAHRADVERWQSAREERLKQPEGWLSLVGLHWIDEGRFRIGRAADNDIVLAVGPERLGTLERRGTTITLALAEDAKDARIGDGGARTATLLPDSSGTPTLVKLGDASFMVIERSGRYGLRVRDPNAATRTGFVGLDRYPIDASWRVLARYEPHPAGKTIPIASIIGTLDEMKNPGAVVFEKDGRTHRIEAVDEGDGQLFLIFADRTSGKSTYGAGRFLYAAPPAPGESTVVVDFNKAYNPPCVFTPYATCPLAPPENRLQLAVEAGEKNYAKAVH